MSNCVSWDETAAQVGQTVRTIVLHQCAAESQTCGSRAFPKNRHGVLDFFHPCGPAQCYHGPVGDCFCIRRSAGLHVWIVDRTATQLDQRCYGNHTEQRRAWHLDCLTQEQMFDERGHVVVDDLRQGHWRNSAVSASKAQRESQDEVVRDSALPASHAFWGCRMTMPDELLLWAPSNADDMHGT
eukprot:3705535-Amphidinium_carterae.1